MVNVIRRQMTKVCFQNRYFGLAMESRQTVAHGETVGYLKTGRPKLRQERQKRRFRPPLRGLNYFCQFTHGFTVGYCRTLLRS